MTLHLAAGYQAIRNDVGAVWLGRDVIRITGPDAQSYLQGQLSQDVDGLGTGESTWSFILQPQGKVDALVRVSRTGPESYAVDTDEGWGAAVFARLQRFKLRTKVDIGPLDWRCLAVRGPTSSAALDAAPSRAQAELPVRAAIYGQSARGVDLLGPAATVAGLAGVPEVGRDAYEVFRIEEGVPVMGAELTERTIPAEVESALTRAVSLAKGCYTGQELVARIDARGGHVPRQLRGLLIDGPPPAPGAPVSVEGAAAGTVTSSARHPDGHAVGLAFMRRDVVPPTVGVVAGELVAQIRALPLVS